MIKLVMMTSWHGRIIRFADPLCGGINRWQRVSNVELCWFLCYHHEQAVEQTVGLPVICDAMTLMRRHSNEILPNEICIHKAILLFIFRFLHIAWKYINSAIIVTARGT